MRNQELTIRPHVAPSTSIGCDWYVIFTGSNRVSSGISYYCEYVDQCRFALDGQSVWLQRASRPWELIGLIVRCAGDLVNAQQTLAKSNRPLHLWITPYQLEHFVALCPTEKVEGISIIRSSIDSLANWALTDASAINLRTLGHFENLRSLDLSLGHGVGCDLSDLASLANLRALRTSPSSPVDIRPLEHLEHLISLEVSCRSVTIAPVMLSRLSSLVIPDVKHLDCVGSESGDVSWRRVSISTSVLGQLANYWPDCEQLLDVELVLASDFQDEVLLNTVPTITAIDLDECNSPDEVRKNLADRGTLQRLTIGNLNDEQFELWLQSHSEIKELVVTESPDISTIASVASCSGLEKVYFSGASRTDKPSRLTSISPLRLCKSLSSLTILNCMSVHESESLADARNLRHLRLCDLGDHFEFAFLAKLTNLEQLDLEGCSGFHDLTTLSHLPKLTDLNVAYTGIADLSPLANAPVLSVLNLSGTQPLGLSAIGFIKSLMHLDVSTLNLSNLVVWDRAGRLETMVMDSCSIDSLDFLSSCQKLKNLDLSNVTFTEDFPLRKPLLAVEGVAFKSWSREAKESVQRKLRTIEKMPSASSISIPYLDDRGLENLVKHRGIRYLKCEDATFTDISPLLALTNLEGLSLAGGQSFAALPPLSQLKQLRYLDLSGCDQLVSLASLTQLENLQILDITATNVNNISFLLKCQRLTHVCVAMNPLQNHIAVIRQLRSDDVVVDVDDA